MISEIDDSDRLKFGSTRNHLGIKHMHVNTGADTGMSVHTYQGGKEARNVHCAVPKAHGFRLQCFHVLGLQIDMIALPVYDGRESILSYIFFAVSKNRS